VVLGTAVGGTLGVAQLVTDPPTIDRVREDNATVEKCFIGDLNDLASFAGLANLAIVSKVFFGIRQVPGNVRGVHVINNTDIRRGAWMGATLYK